ncbi:Serine/threonine-protein kinase [Oleoguttula sp. CCFEE 5521]
MGQGYSLTTLPAGPSAIETPELADLIFEKGLQGARFLRTVRARHKSGIVVAKVCNKPGAQISFSDIAKALRRERKLLADVPNVLPYQRVIETSSVGVLVRQYIHSSLYDRISTRPFLEAIEKKWIAFQLLCAVRDCHDRGIYHGDIKTENVLVTSWGWACLTDFSSAFKPVYLPEDNPAEFSTFFDTSARRTCYLAPERFLPAGQKPSEKDVVQWNMDVFSLGCVLAELFTEAPTFTLSQLFRYRKGEYDPTVVLLSKIDDENIRRLIGNMLQLDPEKRWHPQDYLDEHKGKAFPLYFYQHLHTLMQEITDPTAGRKPVTSGEINNGEADDRIDRIYNDFEILSVSLGYPDHSSDSSDRPKLGQTRSLFPLQVELPNTRHVAKSMPVGSTDNGTFILLDVITASVRSSARAASKVRACELLLAFAERIPDEAKLDRVLPYVMPLLEDSNEMVLVAALRTMTQLLALVKVASPVNSFLFTQYVFPRLQLFTKSTSFKDNSLVRATYAVCLATLAETAGRFLDMIQVMKSDGVPLSAPVNLDQAVERIATLEAFDTNRSDLIEHFEMQTKIFLVDQDISVRRAFLSSVTGLCIFFGESKSSDLILSHLNTYLNDPDWLLKCAFFKTIVGIAVYIGSASLEEFVLPLMLQALADPQEFVVEQALRSLASMAELGLLQRPKTWELIDTVARFTMHPDIWIREAATHFITASTTHLSVADTRILVSPLVAPYLKTPVANVAETELLDTLKKPLPRSVLDMSMQWAKRANKGLFWKPAQKSTQLSGRTASPMPPVSSVADFDVKALHRGPKVDEDEQWLGRLRNAGMQTEDEMKLLAFRELIWRTAHRTKHEDLASHAIYDDVVPLAQLKIQPHTVLFENDTSTYEQHVRGQDNERSIAEALQEAAALAKKPGQAASEQSGFLGTADNESHRTRDYLGTQPLQISALKKQTSGSLSSSPSSGVGLLGRDVERELRQRGSGAVMLPNAAKKALAEVATDDVNASGLVQTPAIGSRRVSPAPGGARRRQVERTASSRAFHNYDGNDPTVLRLLDAVYVDHFPVDSTDFGPLIQSTKRGPIPSTTSTASTVPWRPQGTLVAILNEHTDRVSRLLVAPDHAFFLTASDDGTVRVWDSERLERNVSHRSRNTYRIDPGVKVTSMCFIEATHAFICTGSDGSVHAVKVDVTDSTASGSNTARYSKLRNLRNWQIPTTDPAGEYAVWCEHYREDSVSTLVLATNLNRVLAIDMRHMTILWELHNPAQHGALTSFCIGRRHDWLLTGTSHGVLDLWDLRFKLKLRSFAFPVAAPITRLQLHPSRKSARRNRVCISGGTHKGEVTVWDIEKVICYEVYRPATRNGQEEYHLRDYELRNLDDDKYEGLLSRVADSVRDDTSISDATAATPAVATALYIGQQQANNDTDVQHAFAVTGGPDGRVRFWDCERLDGCRLVSGGAADEKPVYAFSHIGLDTKVTSEKIPESDEMAAAGTAIQSNAISPVVSSKRASAGAAAVKLSRYEAIRTSTQHLLDGHLDTITDVAVLERPSGMVLSADRSGQVYVHQ